MKIGLAALLLFSSVQVNAHEPQRGYTTQRTCYKKVIEINVLQEQEYLKDT